MSEEISASLEGLVQSAEQGDPKSMHLLGKHYFESGDHVNAERWYLRSIEQGNVDSMVNIGVLYFTDGDFDKAKYWYSKAIEFGDSGGMYNLAVLLDAMGLKEQSADWFKKAAELGDSSAMYNLALYFDETGRKEESVAWYYKAIAAGDEDAENNLRILLRELGREQGITMPDTNLFLKLHPTVEQNEMDSAFNAALQALQEDSENSDARAIVTNLADKGHDKARLASAVVFIIVENPEEAHWDLRHVNALEDEDFKSIVNLLTSCDSQGVPLRQTEISREIAEFVREKSAIVSENYPDYWWIAYRSADFAAEVFLDGGVITDYEVDSIQEAYEDLLEEPEMWEEE